MRSRLIAILCSSILLASVAPFSAYAEEAEVSATSSVLLQNRIETYFTGLSEDDGLSDKEILEKEELSKYLPDIIETEIKDSKPISSYGDPKGKYVAGEVICTAGTEEEAQRVANAYDGRIVTYSYGVAVISLPEKVTTAQALVAGASMKTRLPAVWPNECYSAKAVEDETRTGNGETVANDVAKEVNGESIANSEAGAANGDSAGLENSESNTNASDEAENVQPANNEDINNEATGENPAKQENPKKKDVLSRQWMHKMLGDEIAWEHGYKGQHVKVAVIDTGIYEGHEDIKANVVQGRYFGDGLSGERVEIDITGHGSHVAGIIAADDNEFMGTGVAPDSTVGSFLAFDIKGKGTSSDIIRAINAVVDDGSYNIINLSLGGYSYNGVFAKAVKMAYDNGIIVFAAAGNETSDADHYPSDYDGAYSVASINKRGRASKFTNYGAGIDFAFPGENIYSIDGKKSRRYVKASGTSMATAVASGVAAVILSSDEALLNDRSSETVDKVIKIMKDNALKAETEDLGSIVTYLPKALNIE